jgi:hypothetical protein
MVLIRLAGIKGEGGRTTRDILQALVMVPFGMAVLEGYGLSTGFCEAHCRNLTERSEKPAA